MALQTATQEEFEQLVVQKFKERDFIFVKELCADVLLRHPLNAPAWVFLGESLEQLDLKYEAWRAFDRGWLLDPEADWVDSVKSRLCPFLDSKDISPWLNELLSVPKVSVAAAIIAKDEERTISDAITRLLPAVDEIIVVDTGSNDSTIRIAKDLGAQVFTYEWNDDFGAARNFALSKVSAEWVIFVDADEILYEEDIDSPRILAGLYNHFDPPVVLNIGQMNQLGTRLHPNYEMSRFFPTGFGIRWWGKIHEQIGPPEGGIFSTLYPREKVRIRFYHDGYQPNIMKFKDKLQRNISLLEKSVQEDPNDIVSWAFLGRELLGIGDLEKSANTLYHAEHLAGKNPNYSGLPKVRKHLVEVLIRLRRFKEAVEVAERSVTCTPDFPQAWYDLARSKQNLANHLLSETSDDYIKSLECVSDYRGSVAYDSEIPIWKAQAGIADVALCQANWQRALDIYRACLVTLPEHQGIQNMVNHIKNQACKIAEKDL